VCTSQALGPSASFSAVEDAFDAASGVPACLVLEAGDTTLAALRKKLDASQQRAALQQVHTRLECCLHPPGDCCMMSAVCLLAAPTTGYTDIAHAAVSSPPPTRENGHQSCGCCEICLMPQL
jgi:hypothetical protein